MIIDDIHWSGEMNQAWNEISSHEAISISIDIFDAGILFFKKGMPKSHYIIEF